MSAPEWSLRWRYAGRVVTYTEVDVTWRESQDLYQTAPTVFDVDVTISPGAAQNPATAANDGWHPIGSTAVLLRGEKVMLSGRVSGCSYGNAGQDVTLTIASSLGADTATLPPEGESSITVIERRYFGDGTEYTKDETGRLPKQYERAATKKIFTDIAKKGEGVVYPLVFGAPGTADHPGSPGILIDAQTGVASKLMIAGHAVSASTVTVWGPDADNNLVSKSGVTVQHGKDSQGRVYAFVELLLAWASTEPNGQNFDGAFWVSWTDGEALPGGAGDVLGMLYRMSTLDVDVSALDAVRGRLNAYKLAGFVDDVVQPSEYAKQVVLPLLPVSMVNGPNGLRPQLWPWLDADDGATVALTEGVNVSRDGPVRYLTGDHYSSYTVEFGFRPDTSVMTGRAKADAQDTAYGRVALSLLGPTAGGFDRTQTRIVWDQATADAISFDRLRALSVPPRVASYNVSASVYGIEGARPLRVGMPVTITDSDLGWDARPATVGEINRRNTDLAVTLYLRDDPLSG